MKPLWKAEIEELEDLLDRFNNLTEAERQRFDELNEKNEAILRQHGLDELFEVLSDENLKLP